MLKWDYLHCDLKPSNLLLKNSILKVSDFSSCRKLSKTDETTRRILLRKKSVYRSPEMLAEGTSSIKSEIWSLGLILY